MLDNAEHYADDKRQQEPAARVCEHIMKIEVYGHDT
jgi:hypothetical protein